jgi:hypothetical protein
VFDDVVAGSFYEPAVAWMVSTGVPTGTTASNFSPDMSLTRAQFVTFLYRVARFSDPDLPVPVPAGQFIDVPLDSYALESISWAALVGVTNGTSETTFSPELSTTRGQVAAFLHRYANLTVS